MGTGEDGPKTGGVDRAEKEGILFDGYVLKKRKKELETIYTDRKKREQGIYYRSPSRLPSGS